MNARFVVRRTNNDPLDQTWEWLIVSGANRVAVSCHGYVTPEAARIGARKVGRSFGIAHPMVEMPELVGGVS